LIARLDRLARNVTFVCRLMVTCVEFIAAALPTVNKLTVHICHSIREPGPPSAPENDLGFPRCLFFLSIRYGSL
jgi:hypothetical protein